MQLEFNFVWEPKVVEVGYVAYLCDTDIDGVPYLPEDVVEDWFYGDN